MANKQGSIFGRLWYSPTTTSWLNQGVASVRLLILLPLVIRHFDEVEVAAWLLFSSLAFLGLLLTNQATLLFSRTIALTLGGAEDLAPIVAPHKTELKAGPNWGLLGRLYESIRLSNLVLAVASALVTGAIGFYAISGLVEDYPRGSSIWVAFIIVVLVRFIADSFARYAAILRGFNEVALVNRWDAFFGIISSGCGALAITLGASLVQLVVVVQLFEVGRVLRLWYLSRGLGFREHIGPKMMLHRDIFCWLWSPLWRGFIQSVSNRGLSKIGTAVLARHVDPGTLAGVLLAIRLLETSEGVATAPFSSKVPWIARKLAAGDPKAYRPLIINNLRSASLLLAGAIVVIGFAVYPLLSLIGSTFQFISITQYAALGALFYIVTCIRYTVMVSLVGNNVVAVERYVIALLVSLMMSLALIPSWGVYGAFVAIYAPVIVIVNIFPLRSACELLSCTRTQFILDTVLAATILVLVGLLFLCYSLWDQRSGWLLLNLFGASL